MWTKEELNKEFPIGMFGYTISRKLYEEGKPNPMCTTNFDDAHMEELAKKICHEMSKYTYDVNDEDGQEYAFWYEMEECALHMGMRYYEDIDMALDGKEYLYHATLSCNLNSIKKYGLGGKISSSRRLWDYNKTNYKNIKQGVFLTKDECTAASFIEGSEIFEELEEKYEERYGKELEIIVFRVKIKDLDFNKISFDFNIISTSVEDDFTWFYNGVVPFDKLEQVPLD